MPRIIHNYQVCTRTKDREALNWIRREFNEEMEQKLMAASAGFVGEMQRDIDRLTPMLNPEMKAGAKKTA